jgi:hypothetical protein
LGETFCGLPGQVPKAGQLRNILLTRCADYVSPPGKILGEENILEYPGDMLLFVQRISILKLKELVS